jgi:type IV secretion system protein VirD4
MSCVFQNLAGLQNRYPYNQWQEIIGNCDVQLFLGCTDELTATFISSRSGEASIQVTSKAKQLGTWRISDYTPEYRETSGIGRRKVLTMDEVIRLPDDKALIIMRGQKILQVDKFDYSNHPEAKQLISCKASDYTPERPISGSAEEPDISPPGRPESRPRGKEKSSRYVTADKDAIMSK